MIIVPDGYYSLNAASKEITLLSPYNNITAGMIKLIANLTGKETLYDAEVHTGSATRITMAGSTIYFQVGTNLRDTDKLKIICDTAKAHGGTSDSRSDLVTARKDTAANWESNNPVLDEAEIGYDATNKQIRVGDGTTAWRSLPVFTTGATVTEVVGIEWDTSSSSPTLTHIDINGNARTRLDSTYFDTHTVWGNMKRCTIISSTGAVTYGTNARGDGLDLTGASGNVMVSVPKFYVKFEQSGSKNRWWISPVELVGFELHPAFVQRGGTEAQLFVSAYEASGYLDGATFKLRSATNKQPVTGAVAYPDLPNSGRLYITDAETYANNIASTAWGITNIWTLSALRLLFYTEYASLDSQTALGKGIVDLASGTDFAGLLTGALSADTNIGTNGTGTGTGTAGRRPIVYRGIENLWGNVYKWIGGIRFYDTAHRIIPAAGTSFPSEVTTAGKYVDSVSVPPNTGTATSGYISGVFADSVLKYLLLGSATVGSSSTYLCDYYYLRAASATPTCLLFSGHWYNGLNAGVSCLVSTYGATSSDRNCGARLEFLKR